MDSNRLRYFLVVNEMGSIRRAAEMLNLSPAALSKAMKLLEGEVGFSLFVPSGRGILITDQGQELARQAKPVMENFTQLARTVRERNATALSPQSPVRLGSFEVFTTHFLNRLLEYLPADSQFLLREVIPGEMEKALIDHEIDLGLTYIPIPTSGVEHQSVAHIDMGIFGTKEFLHEYRDKNFEKIPFVIPIQPIAGSPNKVQGLDGWPSDRIHRLVHHRVTLMESALELCRKSRAVAFLPTFVVNEHNENVKPKYQLTQLEGPRGLGPNKQAVYIAKRKSDPENEIVKKIARAVRMRCKSI